VDVLRTAMSIFGGHGVMEDFSSLPRLYRDAAVNELWEGPRNVLLAQIHRDLQKVSEWYPPSEFVQNLLPGAEKKIVDAFSDEISGLVSYPGLLEMNEKTIRICQQWDNFCARLFHAYQNLAKHEVERHLDNRNRD
jgi:putative acyl-CoA dehydrogenase